MSDTVYIYTLKDSHFNKPMYVGQTLYPDKRLNGHIADAKRCAVEGRCSNLKTDWMVRAMYRNDKFEMSVIAESTPENVLTDEDALIRMFIRMGYFITNGNYIYAQNYVINRYPIRRDIYEAWKSIRLFNWKPETIDWQLVKKTHEPLIKEFKNNQYLASYYKKKGKKIRYYLDEAA